MAQKNDYVIKTPEGTFRANAAAVDRAMAAAETAFHAGHGDFAACARRELAGVFTRDGGDLLPRPTVSDELKRRVVKDVLLMYAFSG